VKYKKNVNNVTFSYKVLLLQLVTVIFSGLNNGTLTASLFLSKSRRKWKIEKKIM